MTELRQHSELAWNIASTFSHVLASETRDLAAHIDVAFAGLVADLALCQTHRDNDNKRLREIIKAQQGEIERLKKAAK